MPSTCEFEFNNPNGVYFSGDTINATVILTTTSTKEIREVRLHFLGETKVHWTDSERRINFDGSYSYEPVHYRGKRTYVEKSCTVASVGTLPPGTYRYDIEVQLPPECATSCEGQYGHVRYELTLKLVRLHSFDNYFTKPLTVIQPLDLNSSPELRIPVKDEAFLSSCSWLCNNVNIKSTLTLPYGGYVNGQRVNYSIGIENQSFKVINGYTVQFIRIMSFSAFTPSYKTQVAKKILFEEEFDNVCSRLSTRLFSGHFQIDATAPSTEEGSMITVDYIFKVLLKLGNCADNRDLSAKVIIGTKPLRESLLPTSNTEASLIVVTPTAPTAPTLPEELENLKDLPPSYKDMGPPPTFEEATRSHTPFIDIDKEEPYRDIGFIPSYPIYSESVRK